MCSFVFGGEGFWGALRCAVLLRHNDDRNDRNDNDEGLAALDDNTDNTDNTLEARPFISLQGVVWGPTPWENAKDALTGTEKKRNDNKANCRRSAPQTRVCHDSLLCVEYSH